MRAGECDMELLVPPAVSVFDGTAMTRLEPLASLKRSIDR